MITIGLRYKQQGSSDVAEVISISTTTANVKYTSTDGNTKIHEGFSIEHIETSLKNGHYTELKPAKGFEVDAW